MKNETKIQNQNETKKTLLQLIEEATSLGMSISAYVMYLEHEDNGIGGVCYCRYKETKSGFFINSIDDEISNFTIAKVMCRDEEPPKTVKTLLITKDYEEACVLINFRLEKYSKNNNVAFNDIETSVVIEIMQSVANLYEDAKLIKLND